MEKGHPFDGWPFNLNGQSLAPLKCPFTGWIGTFGFRPGQNHRRAMLSSAGIICRIGPSAGGLCVAGTQNDAIDVPFRMYMKTIQLVSGASGNASESRRTGRAVFLKSIPRRWESHLWQ